MIAWSTAPLLDESGNVRNIICGGLDVTERKRHEIELDRERDFLSKVADITPSLLVVVDDEAKVVEDAVNESFVKVMGWSDVEMRGRSFGELFHEEDRYFAAIGVASAFNGVDPQLRLSRWVTREGGVRVVEWTATPIVDILGRERVLVCGVDVTERERREHDLRSSEERLRATIEASPVAVLEVDLDDRIALWNPAAERMFGWSAEEMVGGPLRHIPDEERERLDELMTRVRSGEIYTGIEGKRLCKDGSLIDVEISAAPIRDASDSVISHLALFADISDRKRQEEELRASRARIVKAGDEARRRLERNLHDGAQQRLVALSLSLRLAQAKVGSDPPAAEAVLESAREELAAALDELRELARGIHPAVLTDRGLAAALEALASRLPIPVEIETPEVELPQAVEAAAYYVIAEALANVIKYARASVVNVRVTSNENSARVEVVDDGVGGADPATGSGLRGLSDRVAALEGTLEVDSPPDRRHPHHGGDPPGSRPRRVGEPAPAETCAPHLRGIASVKVLRHERNPQGGSHVRRSQNRSGPPPRRRNRRRPLVVTRGRQRRRRGAPPRERLVLRALGRALPRPRRLLSPLRLRRPPQPRTAGRRRVATLGERAPCSYTPWVSALPTGTVTFLFADVEGSTRLARELDEGWQPVLADLRRLLRETVAAAGGHEVDSRGDELFAVFAEAETAAQAAVDAQRRIAGHNWPAPVRVRIGLHSGTAALAEDGYVGVEVHRAYRIANAGHGGQIVASEASALVLAPDSRAPRPRPLGAAGAA